MKKTFSTHTARISAIITASLLVIASMAGCGSDSGKYSTESSEPAAMAAGEYADSYYDYDSDYAYDAEEAYDEGFNSGSENGAEDIEVTEGGAQSKRKLIRTVTLNIETYDFDAVTASITTRVNSLGGYIESSSVDNSSSSYTRSADYTLRIPAASADSFIASLGENTNITHQSESMEDVTLKYVDNKSRKESLQVEYSRLEELLKEADDIEELIYIENRLSEVRYEIESIEAQLRSYDNLVDYTTIYLYVQEVIEYTEPEPADPTVGDRISKGLSDAFTNILNFLEGLLVFIVVALPYLIVIAIFVLIILGIVKLIQRIARKHREKHPRQPRVMPQQMPQQMPQPQQTLYAQPPVPQAPAAPQTNESKDDSADK